MNEITVENLDLGAKIKVVGTGGGGGNALRSMIASGLGGVDFIAANTDSQALESHPAKTRIQPIDPAAALATPSSANARKICVSSAASAVESAAAGRSVKAPPTPVTWSRSWRRASRSPY